MLCHVMLCCVVLCCVVLCCVVLCCVVLCCVVLCCVVLCCVVLCCVVLCCVVLCRGVPQRNIFPTSPGTDVLIGPISANTTEMMLKTAMDKAGAEVKAIKLLFNPNTGRFKEYALLGCFRTRDSVSYPGVGSCAFAVGD